MPKFNDLIGDLQWGLLKIILSLGWGGDLNFTHFSTLIRMCAFYLNLDSLIPLKGGLSITLRGGISSIILDRYIHYYIHIPTWEDISTLYTTSLQHNISYLIRHYFTLYNNMPLHYHTTYHFDISSSSHLLIIIITSLYLYDWLGL
jgi:hypothetical protein